MTEHDLVKGIDANIIGRIMLAAFAQLFLRGALILACMGFCIIGIAKVLP